MDRNELTQLRPAISSIKIEDVKSTEYFQNEVLRPVIKFQHSWIMILMQANQQFIQLVSEKGTRIEFHEKIKNFITKQPELKNRLIGAIIGLLTDKELSFYLQHQSESNKRINQMICQRISDTLY